MNLMIDQLRRSARLALPALVGVVFLLAGTGAGADPGAGKFVAGELLVKGKHGVGKSQLAAIFRGNGASEEEELPQLKINRIRVPAHKLAQVKAALARNPQVEFVEENFLATAAAVPNDAKYATQWHLPKIAAPQGWDISTGSSNVVIAVIDSGVDPTHPDLAGKLLPGYNFLAGNTDTQDVLGHGTAVAGSAAALTNNTAGIAGVAWNNPLMPLVVLDASNYASYANIAKAITYAVDHGARVLNISIAGSSSSSTLQNAVNYAWNNGAVVIAAAANYATSTPYYPAAGSNVVAVAATTSSDTLASFSNFGTWIDVAAPGSSIYSTTRGGGYAYWNGTSFAAPITAGLAALIWSANPALTNGEVVDILINSADDLGAAGFDATFGHGRINAHTALVLAQSYGATPDTTAPSVAITSPADSATISGQIEIAVAATDDTRVTRVELFIDGLPAGSSTSPQGSFAWDTTALDDQWHTLTAKAYDEAGNVGASDSVAVYVSNPRNLPDTEPPVVTITSPAPGSTLERKTVFTVTASDNVGVTKLKLYVDGVLKASSTGSALTWTWVTLKAAAGAHTVTAIAYDAAGNLLSDSFTVYK